MNNEKWLERWQKGQIGFHELDVHALLVTYLPTLGLTPGDTIFVPLCGASVDMNYLLELGYRVVGCEFSEIACRHFFAENNLSYTVTKQANFDCYAADNIRLYCGDIFQLTTAQLGKVAAIYDRAALIALDKPQRARYAKQLHALMPTLNMLLITITHNNSKGPPYCVEESEVQSLYAKQTTALLTTTRDTPTASRLEGDKMTNVQEHAFHIYNDK
jgi:thiopurine S-methyltransferase